MLTKIKFLKLHNEAKMPTKAYNESAGYDLYPIQDGYLVPNAHSIIPLGFAMEFDLGYAGFIFDRSGMGVRGVTRFAGVIDSEYRGEVKVILYNSTNESLHYTKEKAIAQVVFLRVEYPEWIEVQELAPSLRDTKGFGSTDIPVGRVIDVGLGLKSKGGYNESEPKNQPPVKGW